MKDFSKEYSKLRRYKIQIIHNKTCAHLQLSSLVALPSATILDSSVECSKNYILYSVLLNIYLRKRLLCSFTHWQVSLTVKFKFNCHQGNLLIECSLCGGLRDITEPTILSRSLSTLCKILSLSLLYTLFSSSTTRETVRWINSVLSTVSRTNRSSLSKFNFINNLKIWVPKLIIY